MNGLSRPPIRLKLSLTDFQVLVANGVTTHLCETPTVQLTLDSTISFAQMYEAIETAQEMQDQVGNQAKADAVTNKLFEVIEHMERALVTTTVQVESLGNMVSDPQGRAHAIDAIQFSKGMLAGIQELVSNLRAIIKGEVEIETISPTIPG